MGPKINNQLSLFDNNSSELIHTSLAKFMSVTWKDILLRLLFRDVVVVVKVLGLSFVSLGRSTRDGEETDRRRRRILKVQPRNEWMQGLSVSYETCVPFRSCTRRRRDGCERNRERDQRSRSDQWRVVMEDWWWLRVTTSRRDDGGEG